MTGLTNADRIQLSDILASGDRGGFYYAYAQKIRTINPEAYKQVMIQAQITTYGGLWGGAAQVGNSFV